MDVVYPVRPGDSNEELRFSLRSLSNLIHGDVWIVGYKPSWVTNVEFIEGNLGPTGHANVYQNILLACRHPDVSENLIVMNDDFFITEPISEIPDSYRSTLQQHLDLPKVRSARQSWWHKSLVTTQVCLSAVGYDDPLSYELHVPMPVNKTLMRETLERFDQVAPANPPQWRTLYGALHITDPVRLPDSKAFRAGAVGKPYHSTTDLSWPRYRTQFAALFPEPSAYEDARSLAKVRR